MWNNGFGFGGGCCCWIIIILLLCCCCGDRGCGSGCGPGPGWGGGFGGDCCCWIIIILLLCCCCGGGGGCGCGDECGCNNACWAKIKTSEKERDQARFFLFLSAIEKNAGVRAPIELACQTLLKIGIMV
jgi:hypothetical protein